MESDERREEERADVAGRDETPPEDPKAVEDARPEGPPPPDSYVPA